MTRNESFAVQAAERPVHTPRPKRCGHCQQEFWGAVHDCFPPEHWDEPSDVIGGL